MSNPLDEKLARFEELERRLVDPETLSNPSQYTAVAREHGTLAKLATKYRRFKNLNSQIRDTLEMHADVNETEAVEAAQASPKVQVHLEGKTIRKIIFVPGKPLRPKIFSQGIDTR